jgi:hypothetical protein
MNIFKQLFGVGLLLTSPFIYAAGGSTSLGEITGITIYHSHTGILVNHVYPIDPDQCGRKDYFILPSTHPHYKEAYSMLLAMYTSGKPVKLTVEGCHEGIPAIKHIVVSKA